MNPATLLSVPYVSQLTADAAAHNNDCGAACGVMLVKAFDKNSRVTVDEFYDMCNPGADVYLSAGQIVTALAKCRVVSAWRYGLKLWDLFELLKAEHPVIALINYGVLVDAGLTQKTGFRGAHFIVIVGMDTKYIHIHDPYWEVGGGVSVPIDTFMSAWSTCDKQGNPNCCGIVASDTLAEGVFFDDEVLFQVRVTANSLTVREGGGVNYRAVGYLKKGAMAEVYYQKDGWGMIGTARWISLKYTEVL
jgi:hypothetical protein